MSVVIGQRVARTTDTVQHIARIVQRDGVVMALCGNSLVNPRTKGLVGIRCVDCDAIAGAMAAGR